MSVSPNARRCMAFLVGLHADKEPIRISRKRIANASNRSERSVKRYIAELVEIGWITCKGGASGIPATITVINAIDWILAPAAKMARAERKVTPASAKMAPAEPRIRAFVKTTTEQPTAETALSFPQRHTESEIFTLVKETLENCQLGGYVDYRGVRLRAGIKPDAGTLARIADALAIVEQEPQLWEEFTRRARDAIRSAQSWGLIVNIARQVGGVESPPVHVHRRPMARSAGYG